MINYLSQPVYYWDSYSCLWHKIIGWDTEVERVVLTEIDSEGTFTIPFTCGIPKSHLSVSLIERNSFKGYNGYDNFLDEVKAYTKNAPRLLMDIGVPYRMIKFSE